MRQRFRLTDGRILAFRSRGEGSPLVLLHGWAMSSAVFSEIAELLAADFRVLMPDLRGHGRSEQGEGCALDDFAGDLAEWLTSLEEPADLFGWSFGGQVALRLQQMRPEGVKRLGLISSTPRFVAAAGWDAGLPDAQVLAMLRQLKRGYHKTMGEFFDLQFAGEELPTERYRRIVEFAVRRGGLPEPEIAIETLQTLRQGNLCRELAAYRLPDPGDARRTRPDLSARCRPRPGGGDPRRPPGDGAGCRSCAVFERSAACRRLLEGVSAMSREAIDTCRVRRNFSRQADEYDRYARVQKRVAEELVRLIGDGQNVSGTALDIGTGTGFAACSLARRLPELPLVISDLAHGMTAHAAERLPGALAVDADAENLPFRNESFGLVFSSSVFQWINDLERLFADAARILRPDGSFVFAMYGRGTLGELRTAHRQALEEAGRADRSHMHTFPDEEQVRSALRGAGLSVERLFSVDEVERHADVASLLKSLKKIGAQNAASSRPTGLPSRRVMLRLIDLYTRSFGKNGFIPATYHVIYARAARRA